jgi:NAD(P)H-nitrite reductase large subunit
METEQIICRCEEVTEREILDAIHEGARTVAGVKRRTRAGMGFCQGNTCGQLVRGILAKELSKEISQIDPDTPRPPARPLRFSTFKKRG